MVDTSLGPVEAALGPGDGPTVLFFPGGHTAATTPLGLEVYSELGLRTLSFSRPGYGRTDVGPLTAEQFVPAVAQTCEALAIRSVAATVGLSFGGLAALRVAVGLPHLAPRLILHSCAPSSLPYPDTAWQRRGAPLLFAPRVQGLNWRLVRGLIASDRGLRAMMRPLSTLPPAQWWQEWTPADRAAARATFRAMDSGSGFVLDLHQATAATSTARRSLLGSVPCPTLVTASRHDGGVAFAHAEDFARSIPNARLVETGAATHFAWLGPSRQRLMNAIRDFLRSRSAGDAYEN